MEVENTLVSVITPCYNAQDFVAQTLDSVIAQTYSDWELFVIDDGSKDNTKNILLEYEKKDSRIHYIYQKNKGSSAARNTGLTCAKGRYIAFLDADDLWDKDFLEKQIAFLKQKNAVLVYSSYKRIDENGNEILRPLKCKPRITYKDMCVTNFVGCLTALYDSSVYGKVFLHQDLGCYRDDYAYYLDIVKMCKVAYGNPLALASYRLSKKSLTSNKFSLAKVQYKFYRSYLKCNFIQAACRTLFWAVRGVLNFSK